jgi:glucokinase
MSHTAHLGIDLGGSNIYSVLFDERYVPITETKIDTEAKEGYNHVIARLQKQIETLETQAKEKGFRIETIGLGVPGVVSVDTDLVRIAPNLGWANKRPLQDLGLLGRRDVQCRLVNDVNAGLMGELERMPRKPHIAVAFFCGTGVGGALAIDGKLILGKDGGAGEVGHMIVREGGRKPQGGVRGSLESYVGKWALNRRIERALDAKKKTALRDIIDYNLKKTPVKSSSLRKAYEKGDDYTTGLMNNYYSKYLAAGISQTVNLVNPDLVILGGGIMESMGVKLLPYIHSHLSQRCINPLPHLRLAELGDLAGPMGAAVMARSAP